VQLPDRASEVPLAPGTRCALDLAKAQIYPAG
jgi:hypothetical protein